MARRRSETVSIFACTGSAACLALFEWLQAFHRQLLRRRADNAKRSLLASEGNSLLSSGGRLHQMARRHTVVACMCARTGIIEWFQASSRRCPRKRADIAGHGLLGSEGKVEARFSSGRVRQTDEQLPRASEGAVSHSDHMFPAFHRMRRVRCLFERRQASHR